MKDEETGAELCGACMVPLDRAEVVGLRARHGFESRRVVCGHCGLVQVSPQPDLSSYYSSGQYRRDFADTPLRWGSRRIEAGTPEYDEALTHQARQRADRFVADMKIELADPARFDAGERFGCGEVIEVGCGEGRTVLALHDRFVDARGIDEDADAISRGHGLGSAEHVDGGATSVLKRSSIDELLQDGHAFARRPIVAMWHVLEHLSDPVRTLSRLREAGCSHVYVEVPDVDAFTGDLEGHHYQHVHLYDFSATTLVSTLLLAGFGDVHVRAYDDVLIAHASAAGRPIVVDESDSRVARLRAEPMQAASSPEMTLLERWLGGESLSSIGVDEHALRAELAPLRESFGSLADAYGDVKATLEHVRQQLHDAAKKRIEGWHPDELVRAAERGAGHAFDRAAQAVSHVAHRMGRMSGAYQ